MSLEEVKTKIEVEIRQIDQLLNTYGGLLDNCKEREPDIVEIAALGSVLHSFYNGLENIFLIIAREVDNNLLQGSHWHRDLLVQMSEEISIREPVVSKALEESLADYLAFRHFYRHAYSYFLDWDELKPLVVSLGEVWRTTQKGLYRFLKTLNPPDSEDQHGR